VWSAIKSECFEEILVSTDDPEYLRTVERLGVRTDYLRPAELATDTSPSIDAYLHALDWYEGQGKAFDAVMLLQPPAPFRTPEHIKEAIEIMKANPDAECVTGIVRLGDTHPARIKKLVDGKWLEDFCTEAPEAEPSRRQDFEPPAFLRNGTIYLSRMETIRERRLVRGDRIIGFEMPEANSVNVDRNIDFLTSEAALSYKPYRRHLSFFDDLIRLYSVTE
jgi:CMP-N-acetylneuraminic acid synthetase